MLHISAALTQFEMSNKKTFLHNNFIQDDGVTSNKRFWIFIITLSIDTNKSIN